MSITLGELAELVQGQVIGDGSLVINAARALKEALPGDITFVEDEKHAAQLHHSRASAAVVPRSMSANGLPLIQVADPLNAFIVCRLGDDVILYPNAVLYEGTVLGNRVTIHANAVIGADGFGYRVQNGKHAKVPQLGHVEIGDDCEIGACTTIDRGTFQATRVGEGTKIDNLVQVGHNCRIGRHNLFVSQMGIAGSSSTGDYVVVAGQAGIVDHVHIGDRAMIGAQAGVTKEVAAGLRVLGSPAAPEREQKRVLMTLERLPGIRKDIQRIKQHLGMSDE